MTDFVTSTNGLFDQTTVQNIRQAVPGVEIAASVGGWALDHGFPQAIQSQDTMTSFANQCKNLIDTFTLDGLDFDWEYPTADQAQSYIQLLTAVRTAIGPTKKISIALPAIQSDMGAYTQATIAQFDPIVDYFNIMSYDYVNRFSNQTGYHSGGVVLQTDIGIYSARGMNMTKANIGFPMYAKWFLLNDQQAATCAAANSPIGCPMGPYQSLDGIDYLNSSTLTFDPDLTYNITTVPKPLIVQSWNNIKDQGDAKDGTWSSAAYDKINKLFWTWTSAADVTGACNENKDKVGGLLVWSLNMDENGIQGGPHFDALTQCIGGAKNGTT
ncbi:hypothetical protein M231_04018 [Tremella mesenterica]|uniref:GH18 domain-containing protein n=1 Tax=Tremella mesenterica TaxID=5217 RepID=A0A4Q1BLN6_TREME|nr:hypothetical protein M231_04018 [Tremella mesenterica]